MFDIEKELEDLMKRFVKDVKDVKDGKFDFLNKPTFRSPFQSLYCRRCEMYNKALRIEPEFICDGCRIKKNKEEYIHYLTSERIKPDLVLAEPTKKEEPTCDTCDTCGKCIGAFLVGLFSLYGLVCLVSKFIG